MKKILFTRLFSLGLCTVLSLGAFSAEARYSVNADETDSASENSAELVFLGKSKDGAKFSYNESYKSIIIDGEGSFTTAEFGVYLSSLEKVNYIVIDKNIVIPESGKLYNPFLLQYTCTYGMSEPPCPVFSYAGSDTEKKFSDMLDKICKTESDNKGKPVDKDTLPYKLNIVPDTTETKDVVYVPESDLPPAEIKNTVKCIGRNSKGVRFYYKKADRGLIIEGNGSFTMEDYHSCRPSDIRYVVVGKDVKIPESITEQNANINMFIVDVEAVCQAKLYSYADTDAVSKLKPMVEYMEKHRKELASQGIQTGNFVHKINLLDEAKKTLDICDSISEMLFVRGDVNGDEVVDVTDLTELSLILIGDNSSDIVMDNFCDVDDDSKVTLSDLARLKQYISKSTKNWNELKSYEIKN